MHIDSDNREVELLLRQLEDLAVGAGAFLNPGLSIVVRNGNLSVESEVPAGEPLVKLPPACLIPTDELEFHLEGGSIGVGSRPPGLSETQTGLLECLLAIYNQGNKLEQHGDYLPWLAFRGAPELLEHLRLGRKDAPKINGLYQMATDGDPEGLLLKHYVGSRVLRYRTEQGDPQSPAHKVLMPFIDFFNHHSASPGFQRDGAALVVKASRPLDGSNECFVSYSRMDALDSFLNYGFVDASSSYLRSVSASISLPGLAEITVLGTGGAKRKNPPPPALADLKFLVPPFRKAEDGGFILGGLLIPGPQTLLAMHRILGFVIARFLAPGIGQAQLQELVDAAVEQVLETNERYYAKLAAILAEVRPRLPDGSALQQLEQLISLQQDKLGAYRGAIRGLPKVSERNQANPPGWVPRTPFF